MDELIAENRALREELVRERQPIPPPAPPLVVPEVRAPPQPPIQMTRRAARRALDDEGVTIQDFLKLQTPEFRGNEGEDPQEFLEETEKMIIRLTCSDARVIELVGVKLKANAWNWFQRNIGDRLYGNDPPTWETFKQELMDEFLSPSERETHYEVVGVVATHGR